MSDMGAVNENNWNSHACWNTTTGKAALTLMLWSTWSHVHVPGPVIINYRWEVAFLSTGAVMKIPRHKKTFRKHITSLMQEWHTHPNKDKTWRVIYTRTATVNNKKHLLYQLRKTIHGTLWTRQDSVNTWWLWSS